MKQAEEYRKHAAECRRLARFAVVGKEREQLLDLAKTWESLATDREDFVRRHPELHARISAEQKSPQASKSR